MSSFTGNLDTRWLDNNRFQILSPYRYDFGGEGSGIGRFIEEGTITDLMSLPWVMRLFILRSASGSIASVPHDEAYKTGQLQTYTVDPKSNDPTPTSFGDPRYISRCTADLMILEALKVRKFNTQAAHAIHAGLVVGGWYAWDKYRMKP
jgi:hypothetical protein